MNSDFNPDERKVAVMLIAMQDMRQEMEAMLVQLHGAVSQAEIASQAILRASNSLLPTIEQSTHQAVDFSVQRALEDLAAPATLALQEAIKPIREHLSTLAQHTTHIEKRTQRALAWFSWKWMALMGAGFLGVTLMAWGSIAWQGQEIAHLKEQRGTLTADLEQMQIQAAALEKKGARIQLAQCGGRLCVIANRNQGEKGLNWRGPWKTEAGQPMVIP